MSATACSDIPGREDFLGHPKGVYVCFFTEMWERFSFYGMKALLLLYLLKHHLFGDDAGYDLIGAYGGLVYAVPVIGGLVADRWLGMRKSVVLGGVLLCLGHLGMAVEGEQARLVDGAVVRDENALQAFYFSLALIIMGVGFLKPNISTIVGKLYASNDPRRDSGFTLFYAGINVGGLFAGLVCAFLGETYGWKYGFGAAGIGMFAGLCMFLWGQKYLHGHAEPPDPAKLREKNFVLTREWWIYLSAFAGVAVVWQLIQRTWTVHGAMHLVAIAFAAWFVWFLLRHCSKVERQQMIALLVTIIAVLVFFTLYEQTYGSWLTFTDRVLSKDLFPSLVSDASGTLPWSLYVMAASPLLMVTALRASDRGNLRLAHAMVLLLVVGMAIACFRDVVLVPQTAGSLTFLGSFFIVVLSPLFAWLWPWLERRGRNPGKPFKSAIGLLFAGLSFLPLIAAAQSAQGGALASVWWLVLAYFLLEIGEMCLSPIGLSAVTQLSVARVVGLMMGGFWLATAYSEVLAAQFGKLASIEVPAGEAIDVASAAAKYADLFWLMLWIGLGCAVVAFLIAPLLRRMMHGVK
ncbi:POT family proton-dependent oligopeptide transporter [Luteimonas cucumeris]|uniref:POT family proton-dependent oligopeptide transporter n=1 Tax=Luteimonas cucumeris TaxID=985012 RepID=A0A562KY25_9GAMM|nr:oligopeptide:H+ symporter [Luteimonas cucumeris]TWI00257.1 POT family proton-dependent oligopeptide transporter [Luteimonas cucumeris]